jgi:hypothetical protein
MNEPRRPFPGSTTSNAARGQCRACLGALFARGLGLVGRRTLVPHDRERPLSVADQTSRRTSMNCTYQPTDPHGRDGRRTDPSRLIPPGSSIGSFVCRYRRANRFAKGTPASMAHRRRSALLVDSCSVTESSATRLTNIWSAVDRPDADPAVGCVSIATVACSPYSRPGLRIVAKPIRSIQPARPMWTVIDEPCHLPSSSPASVIRARPNKNPCTTLPVEGNRAVVARCPSNCRSGPTPQPGVRPRRYSARGGVVGALDREVQATYLADIQVKYTAAVDGLNRWRAVEQHSVSQYREPHARTVCRVAGWTDHRSERTTSPVQREPQRAGSTDHHPSLERLIPRTIGGPSTAWPPPIGPAFDSTVNGTEPRGNSLSYDGCRSVLWVAAPVETAPTDPSGQAAAARLGRRGHRPRVCTRSRRSANQRIRKWRTISAKTEQQPPPDAASTE